MRLACLAVSIATPTLTLFEGSVCSGIDPSSQAHPRHSDGENAEERQSVQDYVSRVEQMGPQSVSSDPPAP